MYGRPFIARWNEDGRIIEWQGEYSKIVRSILVGNIDDDPLDELIIFGQKSDNFSGPSPKIVEWNGYSYETTLLTDQASGRLGVLIDIEQDGISEIALTTLEKPKPFADTDGQEPVTLNIIRIKNTQPQMVFSLRLPNGVRAIAQGDVNGDGSPQIIIYQSSTDLESDFSAKNWIDGHVYVHSIDPKEGIQASPDRYMGIAEMVRGKMPKLNFFGLFQCGKGSYLFFEASHLNWKSILKFDYDEKRARWVLDWTDLDKLELFEAAWQSTLAYSEERRAYAEFRDNNRIELTTERHYHSRYGDEVCQNKTISE